MPPNTPDDALDRVLKELADCVEESKALQQRASDAQSAEFYLTPKMDRRILHRRSTARGGRRATD